MQATEVMAQTPTIVRRARGLMRYRSRLWSLATRQGWVEGHGGPVCRLRRIEAGKRESVMPVSVGASKSNSCWLLRENER